MQAQQIIESTILHKTGHHFHLHKHPVGPVGSFSPLHQRIISTIAKRTAHATLCSRFSTPEAPQGWPRSNSWPGPIRSNWDDSRSDSHKEHISGTRKQCFNIFNVKTVYITLGKWSFRILLKNRPGTLVSKRLTCHWASSAHCWPPRLHGLLCDS